MSEIRIQPSRIPVNPQHQKQQKQLEEKKEATEQTKVEVKHKKADDVLAYMADSAVVKDTDKSAKSKNVYQVSNYITPAQADRIKNAALEAFDALLKYEESFIQEFGLSKDAAQEAAVATFKGQHLA